MKAMIITITICTWIIFVCFHFASIKSIKESTKIFEKEIKNIQDSIAIVRLKLDSISSLKKENLKNAKIRQNKIDAVPKSFSNSELESTFSNIE